MANRYWVGGTASWDATAGTKWALTSGGAGGQAVPTSSDDVFFDSNSGAATVTVSGSRVCRDINFSNFAGTFAGSGALTVSGSFAFYSGMTLTYTGAITFNATSTGKTVSWGSKTILSNVAFSGTGGGWTLQDNFSAGNAIQFQLTAGTLDTNGTAINTGFFLITGAGTKALTMGSSTITLTISSTGSGWQYTGSNCTFTPGTSTIICAVNGAVQQTFAGGGGTYYNVTNNTPTATISGNNTFNGQLQLAGAGIATISGANTIADLYRVGTAVKTDGLTLSANQTVTTSLTLNGNSAINRLYVRSNTYGTARTITNNGVGISVDAVDFEDITFAGSASSNFSAAANYVGDCGGNTLTATTPANCYWVHPGTNSVNFSTSNWKTTSGGATGTRVPLPQDSAIFDASSFSAASRTVVFDMPRFGTCNWTGCTNGPTFSNGSLANRCYGSQIYGGNMSNTGSNSMTMCGRGSYVFNQGGRTIGSTFYIFDCVTGTYTLAANYNVGNGALSILSGTFDADIYNVTSQAINITGTLARTVYFGSGTWTGTSNTTFFTVSGSNYTINAETSTITCQSLTAAAKTFAGGGQTYYNLLVAGAASIGAMTVDGGNTFNDITIAANGYLKLTSGTTTTISSLTVGGTAGNLSKLEASSSGSAATLSKASGAVSVDYISIQDSTATGGATFTAGTNSVNVSGNTGWTFTGGGTTYNDTIAESCSGIDILTNVVTFPNLFTETVAATDGVSAIPIYAETFTDSLAATDSLANNMTMVNSITETVAATDSESSTLVLSLVFSETVAATDMETATAVFTNLIEEITAATDTSTGGNIFSSVITETVSATDSVSNSVNFNISLSEQLEAGDTMASVLSFVNQIFETVNSLDGLSDNAFYYVTINESLAPTDSLTSSQRRPNPNIVITVYFTDRNNITGYV